MPAASDFPNLVSEMRAARARDTEGEASRALATEIHAMGDSVTFRRYSLFQALDSDPAIVEDVRR